MNTHKNILISKRILFKRFMWLLRDRIFNIKQWFLYQLVYPIKDWYLDHYEWNNIWMEGIYYKTEKRKNFLIRWPCDDTYVTSKDSYYSKFKHFENKTKFRCHLVWNTKNSRPQKIKDIEIIKILNETSQPEIF